MSPYDNDIRLERRHALTIAAVLGAQFIRQDAELDRTQATDFAIFNVQPFKVAARLRTNGYIGKYKDQFTIRWSRPSGEPTEIDKIRAGFVDYLFYGFVSEDESRIVRYFIGDLAFFRQAEPKPICVKPNNPPDSQLAAFLICDVAEGFVLKSWSIDNRQKRALDMDDGDHTPTFWHPTKDWGNWNKRWGTNLPPVGS